MPALQFLQATPWLFITGCVLLGLTVGSFLNVVIHRLPKMLDRQWRAECAELNSQKSPVTERYNMIVPRSGCPDCGHRISALENIPIVSYLLLGGKCSACKSRISLRYPAVEALSGALSGYIAWHFGFSAMALSALIFTWALIALAFIDLDTFFLPDDITLPLLWAGLLVNLGGIFSDLQSAVIGAAGGYLALWSVFWLFKLATGKEGMGYGDFKLLAAIGAWLGWKMLPLTILLSSLVGAAIGILLMVFTSHGRDMPIPFGPYLAVAGFIAMLYGDAINKYYLAIF